ncbi:MAG: alpha-amylase/alpha-mannosidase [Candidatus Brocadiae bacterium]|nr:alpha-amylase/alpha-mannosidase [Candidatus Brocadiia bacterium]
MADVFVSLLWHHHQPFYREGPQGRYALPWVRLHAIKDYYGMAWLAQQYPDTHLTFNLVPSLLAQIEDYAEGRADEEHLRVTTTPAAELREQEKRFVLEKCFDANWDTMVHPFPRYRELLSKRQPGRVPASDAMRRFSTQDFLDLQVWATLAWFFPPLLRDDPALRALVQKGRSFTEDDKATLLERQQHILRQIIPMYRSLQDNGTAELSVSPYYHPILPLLCDMTRAHEATPSAVLPRPGDDLAEDARHQVVRAVEYYRRTFGRAPRGMWPSEGSVSPEVVELAVEAGFQWIATDEGILARSLGCSFARDARGRPKEAERLYQPYTASTDGGHVALVFRDHVLSDRIGFHYSHEPGPKAAADFVDRLDDIRQQARGSSAYVAVILDGENAWEHYPDGGVSFLNELYSRLASTPGIRPVMVSEYLDSHPPATQLPHVFSGSWINSNFSVWMGHAEDRRAWQALYEARRFLVEHAPEHAPDAVAAAWEELYVAEGSDWFWWYGDDRSSEQDAEFDRLFRGHLQNIYRLLDAEPPATLDAAIARPAGPASYTLPQGFMKLIADGRATDFFEWLPAGRYDRARDGGVISKQTADLVRSIYFGFNEADLYLRINTADHFTTTVPARGRIVVSFSAPRAIDVELRQLRAFHPQVLVDGRRCAARAAAAEILEVICPFDVLGFFPRNEVRFCVRLYDGDDLLEQAPRTGVIAFAVPTPDFESEMWQV